jgi:formylglycine-generating enzyme required for sulfatase activity
MAGGVADWTATFVDGRPAPSLADAGSDADERQALYMGGHWGSVPAQRTKSFSMAIKHRSTAVGFRLALSLDQHGSSSLEVEPMKR